MQQVLKEPSNQENCMGRRSSRSSGSKKTEKNRSSAGSIAASIAASAIGFVAVFGVGGLVLWSGGGCRGNSNNQKSERSSYVPTSSANTQTVTPPTSASASVATKTETKPPEPAKMDEPYSGPLLGALAVQTSVFPAMEFSKNRLGYIRLGGKVPVESTPLKASNCSQGWYKLVDGGYVCGKYATLEMSHPQLRMGITPPNLEEVLPYKYASNAAHGTPLYRTVPSREEMMEYEPYLEIAKKAKAKREREEKEKEKETSNEPAATPSDEKDTHNPSDAPPLDPDAGAPLQEVEDDKPWWQKSNPRTHNLKLTDLEQEADGTVAKRMVKGFYVAIDKTFGWNNRLWYKTTGGLVAPADRMFQPKAPTSQGMDFPEGASQLGFMTGTKGMKYGFDTDMKKVSIVGPAPRFLPFGLTGVTHKHHAIVYRQTTEGWWMKAIDGTFTEPGTPPSDLKSGEKWIDVNLTRKTLVALEGTKPIFGALISPGKKSKIKNKDHSTVQGTFRIREKHITVTMDGDGTVAGDLPYSIEDVPYVAYFKGSYALHGAFWHSNFGHEMSHGCVNLSPLDAKRVFFWVDPPLPRGWHAVYATNDHPGTTVVVHE